MVNEVTLIGNVGKDAEIRETAGGKVATIHMATSEKWKDKAGEWQESTEWHDVVCWGRLAELAQAKATKGALLYVSGKLATRSWEDKDGNKRYTTEVIARRVKALSRSKDEQPSPAPATAGAQSDDDDLLF